MTDHNPPINESKVRSHETNTENHDFQAQINAITNRDLTPDNFSTYADDALADLVEVVEKIISTYNYLPTIVQESGADQERIALTYSGLDPDYVDATLDHIANTADDIARIGRIAYELTKNGRDVIIPPDAANQQIVPGTGLYESKKTIPRLQTALLLLEKNFGIDVDPESSSSEEFLLIPGTVTKEMFRQTPYNVIDLPTLNRVLTVCNEEGNRTFVFDRDKLLNTGVTADVLKDMTKDELKELLELEPGIGRDVIYSHLFVENIVSLLYDIPVDKTQQVELDPEAAKILKRKELPEGKAGNDSPLVNLDFSVKELFVAPVIAPEDLPPVLDIIPVDETPENKVFQQQETAAIDVVNTAADMPTDIATTPAPLSTDGGIVQTSENGWQILGLPWFLWVGSATGIAGAFWAFGVPFPRRLGSILSL